MLRCGQSNFFSVLELVEEHISELLPIFELQIAQYKQRRDLQSCPEFTLEATLRILRDLVASALSVVMWRTRFRLLSRFIPRN